MKRVLMALKKDTGGKSNIRQKVSQKLIAFIRTVLNKLERREILMLAWEPHVMVFTHGSRLRQTLVSFGKNIAGEEQIIANFDLVKSDVFSNDQLLNDAAEQKKDNLGVFCRHQVVDDLVNGIKTISRSYGYTGTEPNAVILDWLTISQEKKVFSLIYNLNNAGLNVLAVHIDKDKEFGNRENIDVWWNDRGQNGNLSLMMVKHLIRKDTWKNASVRLMIVNPKNSEYNSILDHAKLILDNINLEAEIKIINNEIEKKSFYDIVRQESPEANLRLIGMPELEPSTEKDFLEQTSLFLNETGTTALVKASVDFKKLNIGIAPTSSLFEKKEQKSKTRLAEIPELELPVNKHSAAPLQQLYMAINQSISDFISQHLQKAFDANINLIESFKDLIERSFSTFDEGFFSQPAKEQQRLASWVHSNFLIWARKHIANFKENQLENQKQHLSEGLQNLVTELENNLKNVPSVITILQDYDELKPNSDDKPFLRFYKFRKRLWIKISGRPARYKIKYLDIIKTYLPNELLKAYNIFVNKWGILNLDFVVTLQNTIQTIREHLLLVEEAVFSKSKCKKTINEAQDKSIALINNFSQKAIDEIPSEKAALLNKSFEIFSRMSKDISNTRPNKNIRISDDRYKLMNQLCQRIKRILSLWLKNQHLLFNATHLEIRLLNFRNKLRVVLNDFTSGLNAGIERVIFSRLNNLDHYFEKFQDEISKNPQAKFQPEGVYFNPQYDLNFIPELLDTLHRKLHANTAKFPDSIELLTEEAFNNFSSIQYTETNTVRISSIRLLDFLLENNILEPLEAETEKLLLKLNEVIEETQDILRLSSYTIAHARTNGEHLPATEDTNIDIDKFINSQREKVVLIRNKTDRSFDQSNQAIQSIRQAIFEKLYLFPFIHQAQNLKHLQRAGDTKFTDIAWGKKISRLRQRWINLGDQFYYRRSRNALSSKKLYYLDTEEQTRVYDIHNFLEQLTLNDHVIEKVPFYYEQLFLSKYHYYNEFWVGRKKTLNEAAKAIERYRKGFKGGILILGEHNSGKSFFTQYLSRLHFDPFRIFNIIPPPGGSIEPDVFFKAFEQATDISGSMDEILLQIPENSAIIIDDIELWWERSPDGFRVIDVIIDCIEKLSGKSLFIISANIHAFKVINTIRKIESLFLYLAECDPFNAEELRDIIMMRHKASGIKLKLKNKPQENMHSWDYAKLFNLYFNISKGNAGLALQTWVTSIKNFEKNTVILQRPKPPDTSTLDNLETDWFILLVQFVLHKRFSFEKLMRISYSDAESLMRRLNILKRAGIVIENNGIYQLNEFLYMPVKLKMVEKEIL